MSNVVEAVQSVGQMPHYEVSDAELGPGASMGNGHCWVNTGTDGRILTLFSTDVGEEVAGPLMVRYATRDVRITAAAESRSAQRTDVPLAPVGAGRFRIHPAYQRHIFELPGALHVQETVFVPHAPETDPADTSVAYYVVEVTNRAETGRSLSVYSFTRFAGNRRTPVISAEYDTARRTIFAREEDQQDWVRWVAATRDVAAHAVTDDFGGLYDIDAIPLLEDDTSPTGDVLGCLETHLHLSPGETERFAFVLGFTPDGRGDAERQVRRLADFDDVLEATTDYLADRLSLCTVMTPDKVINEGAYWAKVNMLRVLAHYPQGVSFTNEPGVSSNVVARDVAWFVYGCDHFQPEVSRDLLNAFVERQYESGKIPEYYDARTGEVEDYGLNINDATPLFVLALNHHCRSTGDFDYLEEVYDSAAAASEYILSQRDERGLVFCDAEGVEVWGICSWRNVIPNYRINGAVTEVNAECAAALRAMGHMAENIGRDDDYDHFYSAAEELTGAINTHLLDQERRQYLLNIDPRGRRHTDFTADELFPVLFRVAEEDVAFRIIRRLNSPDFWAEAGLRTCSRLDPMYHPSKYVGLRGGVWPGLTWWYAFAAARYHPEFMVRGLREAYKHYNRHPRVYGTVPGQFSEWCDGESLINRGMRLSPWEPPRFLWAAVEGVCGIMVSPAEPGIRPLIPPEWKWTAAVNVPYHGDTITAFAARRNGALHVYANVDFEGSGAEHVLARDVTDRITVGHAGMHPVALKDDGHLIVAVGSCHEEAMTTPLDLSGVLDGDAEYSLREYSSERSAWSRCERGTGHEFAAVAMRLEPQGYHVLEFTRE